MYTTKHQYNGPATTRPANPGIYRNYRKTMRLPIFCALLLVCLAAPDLRSIAQTPQDTQAPAAAAPAQTPPQQAPVGTQPTKDANGTFTIQRTARLVVLDVVVTDAKGNIVTDLKKEDFNVTELKEPETVLNFEATGSRSISPTLDINSTADLDRLAPRAPVNIILLDEFNTHFEDMAFARYSLKKFLEKQPDKLSTPTMLLSVSLTNFTVVKDYTQNKQALIEALDHHFVAYPWQAQNGAWVAERFATAFETLMRVAEATVGHIGHKNMIWIGRGFPPIHLANVPIDGQNRLNNSVQRCVNILRDARITLYTVDPAGLMANPAEYGNAAAFNDPFGGNYQFNKLATATGGKALYGRNDVDTEIGTEVRDGSNFYTLTYRPTNTSLAPQKFRKIEVTVNRPGLTATTREGYYLQQGPGVVNPEKPSRRLAADLYNAESSTMAYDGVPLTLTPSTTDPDSFTILVEARGLTWTPATDTEPRHTEVIVMATTFDKKGKELKQIAKQIKVRAPADVPPTGRLERPLNFNFKLDHDPKAVRARFVVRVTASGRIGTADATLGQPLPTPAASTPAQGTTGAPPTSN
jgi:VWFA-related protein